VLSYKSISQAQELERVLADSCENIVALSEELGVHRRLLYKWRDQLEPIEDGDGPPANSRERELRQQIGHLRRLVAGRRWRRIFSKVPCKKSRLDARAETNQPRSILEERKLFE
jgi:transposase-like protein